MYYQIMSFSAQAESPSGWCRVRVEPELEHNE